MNSLPQLIDSYLAGIHQLRIAVAGMGRDQLTARPVAGKWSTLEVVCHLADSEAVAADRMKRVIAEDKPALIGFDESRFASALAYHDRDLVEELAMVESVRRQMACILRTLRAEALGRVGLHTEAGIRTLEQLLQGTIDHLPHHVKHVIEKRKALGLPL